MLVNSIVKYPKLTGFTSASSSVKWKIVPSSALPCSDHVIILWTHIFSIFIGVSKALHFTFLTPLYFTTVCIKENAKISLIIYKISSSSQSPTYLLLSVVWLIKPIKHTLKPKSAVKKDMSWLLYDNLDKPLCVFSFCKMASLSIWGNETANWE